MQIDHLQACAHRPCICQVTAEQQFCSDHCREMAAKNRDTCACAHAECAENPELAQPAQVQPA